MKGKLLGFIITFAFVSASCSQPAVSGMTEGRVRSLVGAAVGLIGLVVAVIALIRTWRTGAIIALVLGVIGSLLSAVHIYLSTGGFGTGGGLAGAIVGLVLGVVAILLGGIVIVRQR